MEDDEDDFYGGGGAEAKQEQMDTAEDEKDEKMDVSEEGEDDDDDSDDEVQINLERADGAKVEPPPGSKAARQQQKENAVTAIKAEPTKSSTPARGEQPRAGSAAPPTAVKSTLTHNGKEGKDFPQFRSSTIDVNATPNWPANGKPLTELDIDADLAEHSKPWRLPGTDQTDFFNYGFDEYTWTQYCVRQQMMGNTINQQKQEDAQMKAMLGMGGAPGGGGGAAGGMPPMPPGMMDMMGNPGSMEQMAQAMGVPVEALQQMMQSGGMSGMGMGGGNMGGPQGQFNPHGGGFGGGQNSVSPGPQAGQGFQPPQGPSGFPTNMEGFSPQQMAIMQQEQQQQMGGGGGRGGRGRRRGW